MSGNDLWYILACINSGLIKDYFATKGTTTGEGTLRWKKYKMMDIPVPKTNNIVLKEKIISLAKNIQKSKSKSLMNDLELLVRELYGFSEKG